MADGQATLPTTENPWTTQDTFEDHNKIESAFGKLNCAFFVFGFIMNSLVAYAIKKKGIKTPVDVCTLLISLSNWITVFLDLFVGISYIHNRKPMAFHSHGFTQFWGFLKLVNHEWLAALLALLPLSNLMGQSKLVVASLGMGWFVIECICHTIPFVMGTRFRYWSLVPHPIQDHSGFASQHVFYTTWFVMTEYIPYLSFYVITGGLLLANVIQYSNMKQTYIPSTPKKIQDTLTVIGYCCFYLITDFPEVLQHLILGMEMVLKIKCHEFFMIRIKMFFASLFINTIRAAAYPLVFFFTKYGLEAVNIPIRKLMQYLPLRPSYRRFHDAPEESMRFSAGDVEEVDFVQVFPNNDL